MIWESYAANDADNMDVLRLTWHTKYACENADDINDGDDDGKSDSSAGWGFFTWFIVM